MKQLIFTFSIFALLLTACKTPSPDTVPVESISLDTTHLTLVVGDGYAFFVTVLPQNATDKSLNWTTSNPNIAAVQNGKVAAIAVGTATITATSKNGKTAICEIEVIPDVKSIEIDASSIEIIVYETHTLSVTTVPSEVIAIWESSDSTVASVKNGVITANSVGQAAIRAKAGTKTAICQVNVIDVEGIALLPRNITVGIGDKHFIKIFTYPENVPVHWTTADSTIATVNQIGTVLGTGVGSTVITARAGTKTAICEVEVPDIDVLSDTGVNIGGVVWAYPQCR
jgi:uncharacterized protein YjdB